MIEDLKKALIWALTAQAYAALVALPGFGWVFNLPVIKTVVQFIIDKVTSWAVQETAVGLSLLWIQVEMAYEIKSAEDAKAKLSDMFDNPTRYSAAEQQKISEYFDETTVDLIQLALKRLS